MQRDGACTSLWQSNMPAYPSPATAIPKEVVDVLIVGGGLTGITTALMLQKAGKKCIVAEANTLRLLDELNGKPELVALVAVFLRDVRLIDNMLLRNN